ncbi:MAG: hypothetical protein H5U17_00065 [Defluviimonas sp.]|nr:hypothetical protein [Defluviimonas sp.]
MNTPRNTLPETDASDRAGPAQQGPAEPQVAPKPQGTPEPEADQAAAQPEARPERKAPGLPSYVLSDPLPPGASAPQTGQASEPPAVDPGLPPVPEPEGRSEAPAAQAVPAPEPEPAPRAQRRGGFFPALLGGVIAAALGAGATLYLLPQGWQPAGPTAEEVAQTEAIEGQLATLSAEIEALKSAPAPVQAETADALARDLAAANAAQAETLSRLQDIETRLENLESRVGSGDGAGLDPATVEDLRAEMEDLRGEMDTMRQSIEDQRGAQQEVAAAAASAEKRLAAAEAEADRLAAEAEAAGKAARARAALSHLRAALESGAPLAPVIEELSAAGLTVPEALATLPDGAPTLAALRDSFPEVARAALAASLPATAGDGWQNRLGAFLQAQTGARSLDPREGSDPDAVLSRAEAALKAGDLPAALAELEGLPPEGRAETADWEARAAARIAATEAADALAAEIE